MATRKQRQIETLKQQVAALSRQLGTVSVGQGQPSRSARRRRRRQRGNTEVNQVVSAPVTGGAITRPRVPRLLNSGPGVVVENTERFVVVSTAAAGATTATRNDLCPASLGWLNGVAVNYSKWKWLSLQLYYVPACPTSTTGMMAMGLTYDDNDSISGATVALVQQLNRAVSAPVWAGFEGASGLNAAGRTVPKGAVCIDVDVASFDKPCYKYATTAQLAAMSGTDQGIYIPAQLVLATDSGAAATVGHVRAKYRIQLMEPIPATLND